MADLTLNINGNASGAVAALNDAGGAVGDLGDDVGKSVVKWQELANITKKAVETIVRFGVDAVKAYAESERVQAQLTRTAGKYSETLSKQAEAMSRLYAVDDDIIKQSQVLLTQWGGVGAATEDVTKAILDYAAATGQDATAATQDLIRNVESGGVGLAKLGIHFQSTGDKGKDLAAAVAALNGKFGGAATADANTLSGSLRAADIAFEDFKKTIGAAISEMVVASGVLPQLTTALRNLKDFVSGPDTSGVDDAIRRADWINAQTALVNAQQALDEAKKDPNVGIAILEAFQDDVTSAQRRVDALKKSTQELVIPGVGGRTNKGMKDDSSAAAEAAKKASAELEAVQEADAKRNEEWRDAELKAQADYAQESIKIEQERIAQEKKDKEDVEKWLEQMALDRKTKERKEQEELDRKLEEEAKKRIENMKAQTAQWERVGMEMGASFVNALTSQLERLANGGEFDVEMFMADILSTVVSTAGAILSVAFPQAAPIIGAVSQLAGVGIKAGFASAKAGANGKKPRSYHSGGWIGDEATLPRYHSGSWIGGDEQAAILQNGERVLSRMEVAAMGGKSGVDSAARGKPSVVVNVTALDSKTAAEAFETDVGRGLAKARRTGRGDVPRLLGFEGGPR